MLKSTMDEGLRNFTPKKKRRFEENVCLVMITTMVKKKLVDCIGWSKVIDVNVEHIWL